jgi:molybdate transport system substrate-binding protein
MVLSSKNALTQKPLQTITSGAFVATLKGLVLIFERQYQTNVDLSFGSSIGAAYDSIPTRLSQGQKFDVFILAGSALENFIKAGQIKNNTRVDLVASHIVAAIRAGNPEPDLSTIESFKHAMLTYRRISYSVSASGAYLSTELFPLLRITDEMTLKAKKSSAKEWEQFS